MYWKSILVNVVLVKHWIKVLATAKELILEYLRYEIESLDEALAIDSSLRPDWKISRKDKRYLETECGTLEFERRYYRHRKKRIERSLQAKVCNVVDNNPV